jgi:hypothetical protein
VAAYAMQRDGQLHPPPVTTMRVRPRSASGSSDGSFGISRPQRSTSRPERRLPAMHRPQVSRPVRAAHRGSVRQGILMEFGVFTVVSFALGLPGRIRVDARQILVSIAADRRREAGRERPC